MIIDSFDRYGEVRDFDVVTGVLGPATTSGVNTRATHGHYCRLGDTSLVFYRSGETLLLRIGETVVPVDNNSSITYNRVKDRRVLEVTVKATSAIAARVEYALPKPVVAPEVDPTPFAEPEDFDFGLFISNVASDPQRWSRIYRDIELHTHHDVETE
jgi:hypothetical protein